MHVGVARTGTPRLGSDCESPGFQHVYHAIYNIQTPSLCDTRCVCTVYVTYLTGSGVRMQWARRSRGLEYSRGPADDTDHDHPRTDALEATICATATRLFGDDRGASDPPTISESGATAFLSPTLAVADLMRRVYMYRAGTHDRDARGTSGTSGASGTSGGGRARFVAWLGRYYINPAACAWVVDREGDPADRRLTHLVGLNFARSWCLFGLSAVLLGGPVHSCMGARSVCMSQLVCVEYGSCSYSTGNI
jgi:hypothetical protein